MKSRRLALALGALTLAAGLTLPGTAHATIDNDYGWDYQALSLNGNYTMLRGQFAGDAATDLVFYGAGTLPDQLWIGKTGVKGANGFIKVNLSINGTYKPVVGDFAGDDYDDILFYGPGSASDVLLTSVDTSAHFTSKSVKISGTNYIPKVLMDYRGVGAKDDVLFLGPGDVADYLWHFNEQLGTSNYNAPGTWTSRTLKVNGSYQLVIGDYNGDFVDDVVLYQPGTKADYKWISNATTGAFTQTNLSINGTYQAVTVRQKTYDGIYFWASGSANEIYWTSNGSSFTSRTVVQYPWLTGTARTYGGNGVLIQSDQYRDGYVYTEANKADTYYLSNENHDFGTATQVAEGDYNNDGQFDTIWYGPGTRPDEIWYGLPDAALKTRDGATQSDALKATPFTVR